MLGLDSQPLVVFDLETTGLSPRYGDRVCEIGIVLVQDGEVEKSFQTLVNPQRPISPGAAAVNGLTDELVSNAPGFVDIADTVFSFIDRNVVVCHNAPFDLGFLESEFLRIGKSCQPSGVIDTLALARQYFHYRSNKLGAIANALGIEVTSSHRALDDAMVTYQILGDFLYHLCQVEQHDLREIVQPYHPSQQFLPAVTLPPSIQEALSQKIPIEIVYVDGYGNRTRRKITPTQVFYNNDTIYLIAHCHLRNGERQFRLDRILGIG